MFGFRKNALLLFVVSFLLAMGKTACACILEVPAQQTTHEQSHRNHHSDGIPHHNDDSTHSHHSSTDQNDSEPCCTDSSLCEEVFSLRVSEFKYAAQTGINLEELTDLPIPDHQDLALAAIQRFVSWVRWRAPPKQVTLVSLGVLLQV